MSDSIATYTFLTSVRRGIATKIKAAAIAGQRASVRISLHMNVDGQPVNPDEPGKPFISQNVQLIGPGDVIGVSPRAVVRTEPRNWVTDFEPNYLAFIEFFEEDFPWRFTPAPAENASQQTKLRPWIFLMVLEEGEFEELPALSGLLPAIKLVTGNPTILPPPDQTWAWAHVHVGRDITAAGVNTPPELETALENLVRQNPNHALSRLICPRKLRPSTAYHAFLIPSFEVGRLAGLGRSTEDKDALTPSWGAEQIEYPVYYRWYFRTGERGDFEFLVSLLEPREVDARVGIRDMDMQSPNFGVTGMSTGVHDVPVMGLEGALKSPQAVPRPEVWPPADPASYPAFLNDLEKMVNLQETLQSEEETHVQETLLNLQDPETNHPDPIISPPLYGRWHALQTSLEVGETGWVNELNQDPRLRVPAGFGTKVIQAGQEGYMQRAWQQLGDILRANQKIRQVQVSVAASMRMYARHFLPLDDDQKVAFTRQVHARVMGSPTTVYQQLRQSRLEGALKPAFRRVFRPRGAIIRKAFSRNQGRASEVLGKLNAGTITAARPKQPPTGQISLNSVVPDELREDNLTAAAVRRIDLDPRGGFRITLPTLTVAEVPLGQANTEARTFHKTLEALHTRLEARPPARAPRTEVEVPTVSDTLVSALNPKSTIVLRALSTISIPGTFPNQPPTETIVPVMAHPVFADPMYKPLRDLSSELLLPNLNLIPNNTITLMETNPKFIEAYMVGLNHEMARELLWREYPTDQRGSYFRQFWDVGEVVNRDPDTDAKEFEESLRDIDPLHEWEPGSALGSHDKRSLPTGAEPDDETKLVLVIRGDLLKRYPTAVIYAQEAKWVNEGEIQIRKLNEAKPVKEPVFKAQIEPDLYFLGFDLKISEAKGDADPNNDNPGWFFVIQERPGEPRFGLDIHVADESLPDIDKLQKWNDLKWDHLGDPNEIPFINLNVTTTPRVIDTNLDDDQEEAEQERDIKVKWGSNSADMAYILFQVPVMVAIHAANMLP